MKRPEEIKIEFVREWLKKADNDFATAQLLNEAGESYAYATTFHAQQAVEKYLKAFLLWHQIEFKKTHDIQELLNLASSVDHQLPLVLRGAVILTPYGVAYRYPGDYPDATAEDAMKAVGEARHVREEIRSRLPESVSL